MPNVEKQHKRRRRGDSPEVVAKKRRFRAQKAAERAAHLKEVAKRAEAKQAEKAIEQRLEQYFPNEKDTKARLRCLQSIIRDKRKDAEEKGPLTLPNDLEELCLSAFQLNFETYRDELLDLSIEGLKIQDGKIDESTYNFLDKLLESGFMDYGWLVRMVSKRTVSRYGWKLLRNHADQLSLANSVIAHELAKWADDPATRAVWHNLAQEDGKPEDMREVFPPKSLD